MVVNRNERSAKSRVKQGAGEGLRGPSGAHKNRGFHTQKPNCLRRTVTGGHHAGETAVSAVSRRNPHREARDPGDAHVSVRAGHGPGSLCWIFSTASSAISGTRADVDRDIEGVTVAAAVHLLAFSGLLAWECRAAITESAATDATACGQPPMSN